MIDILNKLSILIAPMFYKLLFLSITGTIIGVVILFIRKIFDKRIPPVWKYLMWIVVAVALILPLRFKSNISLTENISAIENVSFREEYDTVKYEEFIYNQSPNIDVEKSEQLQYEKSSLFYKSLIFDVIIPLLWFFGMILSLAFMITNRLYLSYKIKRNTINTNAFNNLLNVCKSKMNIDRNIETAYQDYISSPALFGLIKPKILLPKYANTMSQESLYYIILHELAHYKRKDMLVNYILLTIQAFHWFNPVVWFLFKEIREDMEVLNDSYVINVIGNEQSKDYSKSLVEVLGLSHNVSLIPKLMCMTDSKKNVERRISMIKLGEKFKKHKVIISVICICLIVVVSFLFLTKQNKNLFEYRTDNLINADINAVAKIFDYPQNTNYKNTEIFTENPKSMTIVLETDTATRNFYSGDINQNEFQKIAFKIFATIGDIEQIDFSLDDGVNPFNFTVYRSQADNILGYNLYARAEAYDAFKSVIDDIDKLNITDNSDTEEKLSSLTFPAYNSDDVNIDNMANFNVVGKFPSEWEFRTNNNGEKAIPMGDFLTPLYIYNDNKLLGYIGFNTFEPYTDEIEPENYYKTVYTQLRMSSFFHWDPYKAVVRNDISETGIADIYYIDESEIDMHPGAMPDVPSYETKGILSYNKDLKVYIGIAFMPNTLTDEQITNLAKTVSIKEIDPNSPPDYDYLYRLQTYVSDKAKDELYNIMKKTVEQYQNKEITPDDRFGELPDDFVFPEKWEKDNLDISRRESMGDYRVVLQSSDNKYSMVMIANNFKYEDSNGTSGGDMVIDTVSFDKNIITENESLNENLSKEKKDLFNRILQNPNDFKDDESFVYTSYNQLSRTEKIQQFVSSAQKNEKAYVRGIMMSITIPLVYELSFEPDKGMKLITYSTVKGESNNDIIEIYENSEFIQFRNGEKCNFSIPKKRFYAYEKEYIDDYKVGENLNNESGQFISADDALNIANTTHQALKKYYGDMNRRNVNAYGEVIPQEYIKDYEIKENSNISAKITGAALINNMKYYRIAFYDSTHGDIEIDVYYIDCEDGTVFWESVVDGKLMPIGYKDLKYTVIAK